MSIDFPTLYGVTNSQTKNYSNSNTYTSSYKTSFADYLLQSTPSTSKNTIGDDIAAALSVNINDTSGLRSTFDSVLNNQNTSTDLSAIYEQLLNPTGSKSSNYAQNDTSSSDTFASALQSNFLAKTVSMLSAAQANLTRNLKDYQSRNANDSNDAVQLRISEMTSNVSKISSYLQEKMTEQQSTNQSLMTQLKSNSQYAQNILANK